MEVKQSLTPIQLEFETLIWVMKFKIIRCSDIEFVTGVMNCEDCVYTNKVTWFLFHLDSFHRCK